MIFTDQVGYLTNSRKLAVSTKPCNFQVIRLRDQRSVLDGVVSSMINDEASGDSVCHIDFSSVCESGEYYILAGDGSKSHTFRIGDDIYDGLLKDTLKCFYYQRCGMALTSEYAGEYTHAACHLTEAVKVEDYMRDKADCKSYDMSGGWHDAGDYGRYVSAGAVALAHLLYAYELFPDSFNGSLNIPESGNGIPDILNECAYELKWMLKMQNSDGGVSHKLTTFRHADFVMPEEDNERMLIYPVSSMATGDFAAVMALAYRIYLPFMPEFATEMLDAAMLACDWLNVHTYTEFHNPEGSNTGEYDDVSDLDERLWASAEMVRVDSVNRQNHLRHLASLFEEGCVEVDFGWTDVSGLAAMSVLTDPNNYAGMLRDRFIKSVFKAGLLSVGKQETSGYLLGMGKEDFVWGSNMVVMNRAILYALASMVAAGNVSDRFEKAALEHIHYILGRNPLDISYVTGYGARTCEHPHARVIECDGIDAPMPGWVAGGPFAHFCDEAAKSLLKKGTPPMKCYVDDVGSYSTNEITIYWNSPLVFLLAYVKKKEKEND